MVGGIDGASDGQEVVGIQLHRHQLSLLHFPVAVEFRLKTRDE